MITTLQSCLEWLDRHHDKIISVYRETLEIRTRITKLRDSVQSEATVMDSASSTYPQAIFYEPQNIATVAPDEPNVMLPLLSMPDLFGLPQPLAYGRLPDQEYGPLEYAGVMGSLPEDTNPMICQRSSDVLLSGFVSYEPGAQPFPPHDGMYSEGNTMLGSSSRLDPRPPLPIVQGSPDKVKCTWPGCSKFVKKESRARHVNETHLRKVKTVYTGCGRGFSRSYMKKGHICPLKM
ncbi:hypothetical protein DFJ58DRAFT_728249 [Suillus subalutaceus]|uniref:uncharacterized protein n=1 Tax=Suillus subalutaceus TaxID=48586 RepID=UPI001B87760D|nr:uncharacterized protein DFJ58DRAFT_728249 [Suillus subalutaceus]KAG1853495.1 hypothetical protein DFJ58DRAFT_728249 [Suillus subalutaceus]